MIYHLGVLDGAGVYGSIFHYAFVIAFFGNALLIFIYLWSKKRLDMDEGPKYQMMQETLIEETKKEVHK